MSREWMNPVEAASVSGYCTKTIYRALTSGELLASKRRGRWRIRPDDVALWVEGERSADVKATPITRTRKTSVPKGSLGRVYHAQEGGAA